MFLHGTTSETVDLVADAELTEQFIETFTDCLTEQGETVIRVDAIVTRDRELQMIGLETTENDTGRGVNPYEVGPTGVDPTACQERVMDQLQLRH